MQSEDLSVRRTSNGEVGGPVVVVLVVLCCVCDVSSSYLVQQPNVLALLGHVPSPLNTLIKSTSPSSL